MPESLGGFPAALASIEGEAARLEPIPPSRAATAELESSANQQPGKAPLSLLHFSGGSAV